MAWIESWQELGDHPKLLRFAALLKVSQPQAVGHLHYLWWWALDYAQDGSLADYDDVTIARAARWTRDPAHFVAALQDAGPGKQSGFLDHDRAIHDWMDFAGKLIQKRLSDAARKRAERMSPGRPSDIPATSTGRPSDVAGTEPNPTKPNPTEPNQTLVHASFEVFWDVYPRHEGKGAAKKAWERATRVTSPELILLGAKRYRDDPNRDPAFTAHPSTWLNQTRWDDDPLPRRNGNPRHESTGHLLALADALERKGQ